MNSPRRLPRLITILASFVKAVTHVYVVPLLYENTDIVLTRCGLLSHYGAIDLG